ncbi:MAG TPA: response regulator [Bryobacteraceae bacterium]|nr:response regulator [Bryobacteraceae bacterium]
MQTSIPQTHLRAIIAEDDAALRCTLRQIVQARCEVIAEAENGQVAVELAGALNPDIVPLDISMPILTGLRRHGPSETSCLTSVSPL